MSVSHKVAVRVCVESLTLSKVATKHLLKDAMNAVKEIQEAYDLETMQEIVTHGCQSGVCSQHIYYGDTIKFFDKHEDEIMDYFDSMYDADFLVDLFKDADASLRIYKNAVTWAFIEAIACDTTCEVEYEKAAEYMPANVY